MAHAVRHASLGELPGAPPRLARALNRLTAPRTAPTSVLRAHRWLYEHSAGRIGHGMIGAPTLLLRTTGRRTGQLRCSALCYARDGDRFVLAASNDGADGNPAWFNNLVSDPSVELQVGRRRFSGRAAVLIPEDPDYQRLWRSMNATNHGRYDWYQSKTSRPIPLVMVTTTTASP
ncbi:MAG TPA: nitroreductase family deazaflavin-dependent oxidoreductase [Acidimicrobiales bacterium]|nr:nitroreductase family deazaflavin-dependent oxidoreductase [Acidimicrobiales bacterium]